MAAFFFNFQRKLIHSLGIAKHSGILRRINIDRLKKYCVFLWADFFRPFRYLGLIRVVRSFLTAYLKEVKQANVSLVIQRNTVNVNVNAY